MNLNNIITIIYTNTLARQSIKLGSLITFLVQMHKDIKNFPGIKVLTGLLKLAFENYLSGAWDGKSV